MHIIKSKKILIVSYIFPPTPGIGGRRWAKFAKYFSKLGHDVYVIKAKSKNSIKSQWTNDSKFIDSEKKVEFTSNYPAILGQIPDSILKKVFYRLALVYVKLFARGNYYDKASFAKRNLLREIRKIILDKKIDNVIVTGAPFKMMYLVGLLKTDFEEVNFIADFRDPWTRNRTSYGFESLSLKRQKLELFMEKKVINNFDYIVSVADEMTNFFKSISNNTNNDKFLTISNGFDPEDYSIDQKQKSGVETDKLRIIFSGTLYNNANKSILNLIKLLKKLSIIHPKIIQKLEFNFYGNIEESQKNKFREFEFVNFHGFVSKDKVILEILKSDLGMLVLSQDINYSISTKFLDYLACNKNILLLSEPGPTSNFIRKNNLGFLITNDERSNIAEFEKVFNLWQNNKLCFNKSFDLSIFNIEKLAMKYLKLIN